jgi:transcriptional regulator with XRE-family HTH domain
MPDPAEVGERLIDAVRSTTPAELRAALARPGELMASPADDMQVSQLVLFQAPQAMLPLRAYLATALSGLDEEQRALIDRHSEIVDQVCRDSSVQIELYQPGQHTDPRAHQDVADTSVFHIDHELVVNSDLLIHLAHFPSTGAGEELDMALNALVPIVLVSHADTRISRMITGIPGLKIHLAYRDEVDLATGLRAALLEIRPTLENRKLAFSAHDTNVVGLKIRSLRQDIGLTRNELAQRVPGLSKELLANIEDSTDRSGNPTLMQLRMIAAVLHTTVADLVEPSLSERLMAELQAWITPAAARSTQFGDIPIKDRNRILRRLLLRFIDTLEESD